MLMGNYYEPVYKDKWRVRIRNVLVEAAGIEPASENLSIWLSTGVFCLLRFPRKNAGKRALMQGSPKYIMQA